jgi:hypothetical protein
MYYFQENYRLGLHDDILSQNKKLSYMEPSHNLWCLQIFLITKEKILKMYLLHFFVLS